MSLHLSLFESFVRVVLIQLRGLCPCAYHTTGRAVSEITTRGEITERPVDGEQRGIATEREEKRAGELRAH